MKRIESLDYLRGLMALSVMLYHYISWGSGPLGSETLLGKLGIYAVSVFYILSGLSLTIVYRDRLLSWENIKSFFIKRVFRLFPLFWLATSLSLGYKMLDAFILDRPADISLWDIFLNYTLLFGYIKPDAYITTGAWSIGNEMVFYTILPVVLFFSKKKTYTLIFFTAVAFLLYIYFAFSQFDTDLTLDRQWSTYINPFNQLFLFMAGVFIGFHHRNDFVSVSRWTKTALLLISFYVFWLYPSKGSKIELVTGSDRIFLSFIAIWFVFLTLKLNPVVHFVLSKMLIFLGEACYSIYLIHPLISLPLVVIAQSTHFMSVGMAYSISVPLTLIVSGIIYRYIEIPMMNLGKQVADGKRFPFFDVFSYRTLLSKSGRRQSETR